MVSASSRILRKQQLLFSSFLFWVIIGFRSLYVGTDTLGYCNEFFYYSQTGLDELVTMFYEKHEPLYLIATWMLSQLTSDYTIFLLFWSYFTVYAIYKAQKVSLESGRDLLISYLSVFLVGLFAFFVAGIRQTFAISIALMTFQYLKQPFKKPYLKDRNSWMFVILVMLAYYVHNSILLFALIYPFKNLLQTVKVKWWYVILLIGLYGVGSSISFAQINEIASIFFSDRYAGYQDKDIYDSSWSASAYIMQLILFLICFLVHSDLEKKDRSNTLLMNLVLIALAFQSMAGTIAEMARLAYYFSVFYVILLPRALAIWSKKYGGVVYGGFVVVSLIYLFFLTSSNLPKYTFFWN